MNSEVTSYLLDVQPGLWKVLAETEGSDTTRYLHGPLGIQSQQNPDGSWVFPTGDALGRVHAVTDADLVLLESRSYSPYGEPFGIEGANAMSFGFTGEPYDSNGLLHLRARYYDAAIGRFFEVDPSNQEENLYAYGVNNPVRFADPTGLIFEQPLTCEDPCEEKCKGALSISHSGCVFQCRMQSRSVAAEKIRGATIMIGLGSGSPDLKNCTSGFGIGQAGLGTLTRNGILTHDHIVNSDFSDISRDQFKASEYIKEWPCISLVGAFRSIPPFPTSALIFMPSPDGTVLISTQTASNDPGFKDLSSLGKPIDVDNQWKGVPGYVQDLLVAIVRGPNSNNAPRSPGNFTMYLDHSRVGVVDREVDYSYPLQVTTMGSGGLGDIKHDAYRTLPKGHFLASQLLDDVEIGDSGGGVFASGKLVGVNFAVNVQPEIEGMKALDTWHFFVPVF